MPGLPPRRAAAVAEAGFGFERVPEGVAEIENCALAGLALVRGDDRGLYLELTATA